MIVFAFCSLLTAFFAPDPPDQLLRYRLHLTSGETVMLVGYRESQGVYVVELPDGRRTTVTKSAVREMEHLTDQEIRRVNAPNLTELVDTYRAWGLPFPPENADLVYCESSWRTRVNEPDVPLGYLGFVIQGDGSNCDSTLLVGTESFPVGNRRIRAIRTVDPDEVNIETVVPEWPNCSFEVNAGIATAIQCKARGWDKIAESLLEMSLGSSCGHGYSIFFQPPNQSAKTALAFMAWAHWANILVASDSDRKLVAAKMKSLIATERRLNTESNRAFVQALEATLVPSYWEPGTAESLIDDLRELHIASMTLDSVLTPNALQTSEPDVRILRLLSLGFDAVPALINHLDDRRLTRGVIVGMDNMPTTHLKVGSVVRGILEAIAGQSLRPRYARDGATRDDQDVIAWWRHTRTVDERTYLREHAKQHERRPGGSEHMIIWVLGARYPDELVKLYKSRVVEPPNWSNQLDCEEFAEAIAKSGLPKSQRLELLRFADEHGFTAHSAAARRQLVKFEADGAP